jgi:hypothetical protein
MSKHFFTIVFFCTCFTIANSQNITGNWYGVGNAVTDKVGNSYLTEIQLVQKGNKVTGTLSFYFRDSLFSSKISGTFYPDKRIVELSVGNIIFYKSNSTITGIECPMKGKFLLRVAKTESVLNGSFYAIKSFRFTCPTINLKLKKESTQQPDETLLPITKNEIITTDTIITNTKPTIVEPIESTPEEKIAEAAFIKREKKYAREIEITSNELKLEFYDNGSIDGDSISVFFNNRLVLPKTLLNHRAVRFTVKYNNDLPFNELAMFAESLGAIPPNSAALIIHDGDKRYEVLMTSDFSKTGTIKLTKKKALQVE